MEAKTVSIEVAPFINGLEFTEFNRINPKAFDCKIEYLKNVDFIAKNIEFEEGRLVIKGIPLNQQGVEVVPSEKTTWD